MPTHPEKAAGSVVVIGALGGIGSALADQISAVDRPSRLFVLSRRHLADWKDGGDRTWLPVDLLDEASVEQAAAEIGGCGPVDQVWVTTGLLHRPGLAPEKSMRALDAGALAELFQVNAIGPALVAKHFLPLAPKDRPSLFAALSARVGSISDNGLGGWYGYRASKAALNMLIRTLAIEQRRTHPLSVVVALHPGTVATELSKPFQRAWTKSLQPDQAAAALRAVAASVRPEQSGSFFAWDGTRIPW